MEKLEFTIKIQEPDKSAETAPARAEAPGDALVPLVSHLFWLLFWLSCLYLCFAWSPFLILPVALLNLLHNLTKRAWWL